MKIQMASGDGHHELRPLVGPMLMSENYEGLLQICTTSPRFTTSPNRQQHCASHSVHNKIKCCSSVLSKLFRVGH